MLYSEFVEGTGCRENEHNFEVYRNLEILYMNSNLSKQEIYEYGKKLVDNRKSEQILAFEAQLRLEIVDYRAQIAELQKDIKVYRGYLEAETDKACKAVWRSRIRTYRKDIERCRLQIKLLKSVLN